MREPLHTARLTLAPWTPAALPLLARLAATPAVVRHIGDGLPWSEAKVHDVSDQNARHWDRHGFGWRRALERDSGQAIGFIGLNFAGENSGVDPGEYEIGWWLDPAVWGRGLAREGGAAVRDEAFERLGAPSLLARIAPANDASQAVARALGLRDDARTSGRAGEPVLVLRISRAAWRARPRSAPPPAPA